MAIRTMKETPTWIDFILKLDGLAANLSTIKPVPVCGTGLTVWGLLGLMQNICQFTFGRGALILPLLAA